MFKLFLLGALVAIAFAAPAPEAVPDAAPEASPEANPDLLFTHTVPIVPQALIYKSPIVPVTRPYSIYSIPAPYFYYPNYYYV